MSAVLIHSFDLHSYALRWTLIHLVLNCRSSTRARARGRGKATFSFKASVCSGRRVFGLIQQPGRPHLIPFKTRLSESHMHIIFMRHDALASQPPDAFFRSLNAILCLWRQARKISTFTRFVSAPHTGKDLLDGRDSCVFLLFPLILSWTKEKFVSFNLSPVWFFPTNIGAQELTGALSKIILHSRLGSINIMVCWFSL